MKTDKANRRIMAMVLVLIVLILSPVQASAKGPFEKLLIYGEATVFQASDASLLAFDAFNEFSDPYPVRPSVYGPGYLIIRYGMDQESGKYIPFDSLRFFPARGLQLDSFVYYEGLVNGWSEYDAKWYMARPEVAAHLTSLASRSANETVTFTRDFPWSLLSGFLGVFIGFAGMKLLGHRRSVQ